MDFMGTGGTLWLWVKVISNPVFYLLVTPSWSKKKKKQIQIVHVMRGGVKGVSQYFLSKDVGAKFGMQ